MSKRFKEYLAEQKAQVNEAATAEQINKLKETPEFKGISKLLPKVAQQIELVWGYPEFYTFVQKIVDGQAIGGHAFGKLHPITIEALGALTHLHMLEFSGTQNAAKNTIKPDIWGPEYERGFKKRMTESEYQDMRVFLAE